MVTVFSTMPTHSATGIDDAGRPNILFILSDDQGWSTLGCYGNPRVRTPHLDALASQGVRFTDAYVQPQCTPTRASLLTGQETARNRMWHVIGWYGTPWAPVVEPAFREQLPRSTFNVAKGLRDAGYATAILGKWHLTTNGDGNYLGLNPESAHHYGFDVSEPTRGRGHQQGDKDVDLLTDQAIAFIEEHRERPWFCYLSHHTIHGPVLAPEPLVEAYLERGAPAEGLNNATYLAAIEHLDRSVCRLMAALEEFDLTRNTMVVFLSDNGGVDAAFDIGPFKDGLGTSTRLEVDRFEFDNAPLRAGKGSPYEGGIRVPCLVRWPGVVEPGRVESTPIHIIDWLPTLLESAGATVPDDHIVDGLSLVGLLRGTPLAERSLHWYLPLYDLRWGLTPCAIVRRGDLKLIEYFGDIVEADGRYRVGPRVELYNLADDLGEAHDLADDRPVDVAQLRAELSEWMRSVPVEVPGPNPFFDPTRPLKETREKPPHRLDSGDQ